MRVQMCNVWGTIVQVIESITKEDVRNNAFEDYKIGQYGYRVIWDNGYTSIIVVKHNSVFKVYWS